MLLGSNEWDAACDRYAAEHDTYYGALHTITSRLLYLFGKDALRAGLAAHAGNAVLADGTIADW